MAFLGKARKDDLKVLAEELDEVVTENMKVIDLQELILKAKGYEEEFVKNMLETIIEERIEKENIEMRKREWEREKELWKFEKEKLNVESPKISEYKNSNENLSYAEDCLKERNENSSNINKQVEIEDNCFRDNISLPEVNKELNNSTRNQMPELDFVGKIKKKRRNMKKKQLKELKLMSYKKKPAIKYCMVVKEKPTVKKYAILTKTPDMQKCIFTKKQSKMGKCLIEKKMLRIRNRNTKKKKVVDKKYTRKKKKQKFQKFISISKEVKMREIFRCRKAVTRKQSPKKHKMWKIKIVKKQVNTSKYAYEISGSAREFATSCEMIPFAPRRVRDLHIKLGNHRKKKIVKSIVSEREIFTIWKQFSISMTNVNIY